MKVFTTFAALLVTCSEAQINFVPASVLIPVHNISLWNITKPALNTNQWNNTVPKPPRWYGPSYPYYPSWNNTTPSGDLIVGKIGYLDRLLFNQVKVIKKKQLVFNHFYSYRRISRRVVGGLVERKS